MHLRVCASPICRMDHGSCDARLRARLIVRYGSLSMTVGETRLQVEWTPDSVACTAVKPGTNEDQAITPARR